MAHRNPSERTCSYVVFLEADTAGGDHQELAQYLSALGVAGCEVVIVDPSPHLRFALNARVLRWVGRHVALAPEHCTSSGNIDYVRAAASIATCEKVIVATDEVRYEPEAVAALCSALDSYDAAEPDDYYELGPWWSGVEAGRLLAYRAVEPNGAHCVTFGFRRSALQALEPLAAIFSVEPQGGLSIAGANVCTTTGAFVRRLPGTLAVWLGRRTRQAELGFANAIRSGLLFSILPLFVALAILGGARLAATYAISLGVVATFAALRGRAGATRVFPLRAALYAPLALLEASLTIYLALYRRVSGAETAMRGLPVPEKTSSRKVASGG